jgi:outer membrane protein assembly factor BamE
MKANMKLKKISHQIYSKTSIYYTFCVAFTLLVSGCSTFNNVKQSTLAFIDKQKLTTTEKKEEIKKSVKSSISSEEQQGNILTLEDFNKIDIGMSREQIRYLIGSPVLADNFHPNRWDYLFRGFDKEGNLLQTTARLTFNQNNRLMKIDGVAEMETLRQQLLVEKQEKIRQEQTKKQIMEQKNIKDTQIKNIEKPNVVNSMPVQKMPVEQQIQTSSVVPAIKQTSEGFNIAQPVLSNNTTVKQNNNVDNNIVNDVVNPSERFISAFNTSNIQSPVNINSLEKNNVNTNKIANNINASVVTITPQIIEEVKLLLTNWSNAWVNRQYADYFAFYSEEFQPEEESLNFTEWKKQRQLRFEQAPDNTTVVIEKVQFGNAKGKLAVKFKQKFSNQLYQDDGVKELFLIRESGKLKIKRERFIPTDKGAEVIGEGALRKNGIFADCRNTIEKWVKNQKFTLQKIDIEVQTSTSARAWITRSNGKEAYKEVLSLSKNDIENIWTIKVLNVFTANDD